MNMQHPETCARRELAAAWALNALDPEYEASFVEHLAQCPQCRDVVDSTAQIGGMLGAAVEHVEPPAGLRARVLAAVEAEQSETGDASEDHGASSGSAEVPTHTPHSRADAAEPVPPVVELPVKRRWPRVLAAAVIVALTLVSAVLGVRVAQLSEEKQRAENSILAMRMVADPAARRVIFDGTNGQPTAAMLADADRGMVMPTDLPTNNVRREIYVMWGMRDGQPVALGMFDVAGTDGQRPEAKIVSWAKQTERYPAYAISIEQGRSMPKSPSKVVAKGQVPPGT